MPSTRLRLHADEARSLVDAALRQPAMRHVIGAYNALSLAHDKAKKVQPALLSPLRHFLLREAAEHEANGDARHHAWAQVMKAYASFVSTLFEEDRRIRH
jgi:hypothetical protein